MEALITWIVSLFGQLWVIGWLLVIIILWLGYSLIKYIPIAFKAHFAAMDNQHKAFSENLSVISDKFIKSVDVLWQTLSKDHEYQNNKLNEI